MSTLPRLNLIADEPTPEVVSLLGGKLPGRWGRMPLLSRLLIVETGRVLLKNGYLQGGSRLCDRGLQVGLVGATMFGSHHTDLAFKETMGYGPGLASPALFGYTLPNAPLAEAAVIFGLAGPVYALFKEPKDLLGQARQEATALLADQLGLNFMLACGFDHRPGEDRPVNISVTLTVVTR